MTASTHRPPDGSRSLRTALSGVAFALGCSRLAVADQPIDLHDLLAWWNAVGTAAATMEILRLAAIALGIWLAAVGLLGALVAATTSHALSRLWRALTPRLVRRIMATTAAAGLAASCSGAAAQDGRPAPPPPEGPLLIDLGPATVDPAGADDTPVLLVDLGPAAPSPDQRDAPPPGALAAPSDRATTTAVADTWQVETGDHLWSIAEDTLLDRGLDADEPDITRYWQRLIDANRDAIGSDPDLIHPGVVLRLPE